MNHRLVLDGIFWIARSGSPWRDLPEEFGKWSSVYRQFRRWTLPGLWDGMLDALNESGLVPAASQMIYSTVVRAHHQAAGAKEGLRDRVLAVREVASRPRSAPRQWRRPAHEVGHHAGPDFGLSGLRPHHGRQPARALGPAGGSRL